MPARLVRSALAQPQTRVPVLRSHVSLAASRLSLHFSHVALVSSRLWWPLRSVGPLGWDPVAFGFDSAPSKARQIRRLPYLATLAAVSAPEVRRGHHSLPPFPPPSRRGVARARSVGSRASGRRGERLGVSPVGHHGDGRHRVAATSPTGITNPHVGWVVGASPTRITDPCGGDRVGLSVL